MTLARSALPPQHSARMWDQCSRPQHGPIIVMQTVHALIPHLALHSASFCFTVSLTGNVADADAHDPRAEYAASDALCLLMTLLVDAPDAALAPDIQPMQPHALNTESPSPSSLAQVTFAPQQSGWLPYPLPPSLRRVCYFSHYDRAGDVAPHTLHLLDAIILMGFHVVFVTCSPWLTSHAQRQLQHRSITYVPPTSAPCFPVLAIGLNTCFAIQHYAKQRHVS